MPITTHGDLRPLKCATVSLAKLHTLPGLPSSSSLGQLKSISAHLTQNIPGSHGNNAWLATIPSVSTYLKENTTMVKWCDTHTKSMIHMQCFIYL